MKTEPALPGGPLNGTVWEEYVDIAFLAANGIFLSLTSCGGIAANLFITWAVYHQRSLQTWKNTLLVNLAVVDLLRCAVDCPLLLTVLLTVHRRGHADKAICYAQVASFSFSCCLQLLTLACISAERYRAIAHPFRTSQRRRRILTLIPVTWLLAVSAAVLCLTHLKDSPVYVKCRGSQETAPSFDTFGLYLLVPLWTACFAVITGFYASICAVVRLHNRRIFDRGTAHVPREDQTGRGGQASKATVAGVENPHTSDQTRTQTEPVAQVEKPTAQLDPSSKVGCTHKSDYTEETPENRAELPCRTQQPQSAEGRAGPSSSDEDAEALLEGRITGLQNRPIKNTEPEAAVPVSKSHSETGRPRPKVMQVKPKQASEEDAVSVPSPTTWTGGVLKSSESRSEGRVTLQSDERPSETGRACPHVGSTQQPDSQRAPSLLISDMEQDQSGEEAHDSAQAANDVPETKTTAEQYPEVDGAVCIMPSFANKERANKKKESKMAKRTGYIILTFLLFWLPLITTILSNIRVPQHRTSRGKIVQHVEILSVSVACMTSLSDPIIYAAVNPQFRTEWNSLRNKFKSLWI